MSRPRTNGYKCLNCNSSEVNIYRTIVGSGYDEVICKDCDYVSRFDKETKKAMDFYKRVKRNRIVVKV